MNPFETKDVVIVGAGGLGREVLWALRHPDATVMDHRGTSFQPKILGFLDDYADNHGLRFGGVSVLGCSNWLDGKSDVLVVVAVGIPGVRQRVVEKLQRLGASFATCISPLAIVGDDSHVHEGSIILPGAVVTVNAQIGRFVLLNPTTSVSHDCIVGDYTSLGPGASLAGNVHIGTGCDIGTNAGVLPGIRVGDYTVIGAMACVTKDIPDNAIAVGIPAKVIRIADPANG